MQRLVDDQLAARAVDDAHAVLHLRERLGVRASRASRRVTRQVEREEVGGRVDLVRGGGLVDAELAVALGRHVRVVGDDVHAEAARALGDELADAAEAERSRASSRRPRRRRTSSAATCARAARRAPAGCCARARASARACARRRRRCSTAARWRRRSRAWSRPRRRRCRSPMPARPITFSLRAERDRSRRRAASRSGSGSPRSRRSARGTRSSVQSAPRSTSKRSRSRSTPASAICSLTRMRGRSVTRERWRRDAGFEERPLRGADACPLLDLVAELRERHLQARQRREDVEAAEVAAVRDADDLAGELRLAAVGGDAVAVAQDLRHLLAVDRRPAARSR